MEEGRFQGRVRNGRSCGLQPPRSSSRAAPAKTPPRQKATLIILTMLSFWRGSAALPRQGRKKP